MGNPLWQGSGGEYASKWFFYGAIQRKKGPGPYSTQAGKGTIYQTPQGKIWQAPKPEQLHPVLIKFMARFLQKYATHYFVKLLIAKKNSERFAKIWGQLTR